jgi:DNA-binding NtrC family response regulator
MALKRFSDGAMHRLQAMEWPGNVRELRNMVERMVIMTPGSFIEESHLESGQGGGSRSAWDDVLNAGGTFQEFKERAEAAFIRKQLEASAWNISRTAEVLDIQRSHLYNKMKKYGLERKD